MYRRVYRNYLNVIAHILENKYPAVAILRNSCGFLTLKNHSDATAITALLTNREFSYDIREDVVTICSPLEMDAKPVVLKLSGAISHGDIPAIFGSLVYQSLPVRGKSIVDIGAGIADSSIYFAQRGAATVIGIEPFPTVYQIGMKNVESNNLSSKITLVLAGCGGEQGYVRVDPYAKTQISTYISNVSDGIRIPLLTLEYILEFYNIGCDDPLLKMDCEGWEYDIVLTARSETLRKFSHILIEYHYGYENLKDKLKESGFQVSVNRPTYDPLLGNPYRRPDTGRFQTRKLFIGYLHARRR
jgi:FkbM family methyltransferase